MENKSLYTKKYNNVFNAPLIHINNVNIDENNFQNRNNAFSEESVISIIDSILKSEFIPGLFDAIKIWENPLNRKLYVIAGNSRLEAFRRLSIPPLSNNPDIIKFQEKYNINFSYIPYIILPKYFSLSEVKTIAAISNTLSTPETSIERAKYYRILRKNKSFKERDKYGKIREKKNWNQIKRYSFLKENGSIEYELEKFQSYIETSDGKHLEKIATRIGKARYHFPELEDQHEKELFDWLFIHKGYGTQKKQVYSYTSFEKTVKSCLNNIETLPGGILNIRKLKGLSSSMTEYYRILNDLKQRKKEAMRKYGEKRREISKKITENSEIDLFSIHTSGYEKQKNLEGIMNMGDVVGALEYLEAGLKKLEDSIDNNCIKEVKQKAIQYIIYIESQIHQHKGKISQFEEATKLEKRLFE